MISEEAVTLEARLIAIEHLLTHLAKTVYLVSGFPDTLVSQAHKNVLQGLMLNRAIANRPVVAPPFACAGSRDWSY